MKTHDKHQEKQSRTLDANPKASRQASWDVILQKYAAKNNIVQREAIPDEDELLQGKFNTVQRDVLDDEEPLQGKFESTQRESIEDEEDPIQQKKENKTGLPDDLKEGVENLSGFSMDNVRVHYNSEKPAQLNALAYAQGTDIHVGPGQEKHLSHEAWHVVQQKQGRVQPTRQLQGINVNDNEGLEREADSMGNRINSENPSSKLTYPKNTNNTVQAYIHPDAPNTRRETSFKMYADQVYHGIQTIMPFDIAKHYPEIGDDKEVYYDVMYNNITKNIANKLCNFNEDHARKADRWYLYDSTTGSTRGEIKARATRRHFTETNGRNIAITVFYTITPTPETPYHFARIENIGVHNEEFDQGAHIYQVLDGTNISLVQYRGRR